MIGDDKKEEYQFMLLLYSYINIWTAKMLTRPLSIWSEYIFWVKKMLPTNFISNRKNYILFWWVYGLKCYTSIRSTGVDKLVQTADYHSRLFFPFKRQSLAAIHILFWIANNEIHIYKRFSPRFICAERKL